MIVTPPVAPTESQNPTDQASSGSTRSRATTGERQHAHRLVPPAEGERRRAERRHQPGAQHRRLGAGDHDEPGDQQHRQQPTGERRRAAQDRPGRRDHECHVLSRHRHEMAQSTGAKPLDHLRRLVPVVADDETAGQDRLIGPERAGSTFDQLAHPVRRGRQSPARHGVAEPIDIELPDHVLPRDPADPVRLDDGAQARQLDVVAGAPFGDAELVRAPRRTHASNRSPSSSTRARIACRRTGGAPRPPSPSRRTGRARLDAARARRRSNAPWQPPTTSATAAATLNRRLRVRLPSNASTATVGERVTTAIRDGDGEADERGRGERLAPGATRRMPGRRVR